MLINNTPMLGSNLRPTELTNTEPSIPCMHVTHACVCDVTGIGGWNHCQKFADLYRLGFKKTNVFETFVDGRTLKLRRR